MSLLARSLLLVAFSLLGSCASVKSETSTRSAPPHHVDGGFRNNYVDRVEKPFGMFLKWRYEALRDGLPPDPRKPTPAVAPDLAFIERNATAGAAMQPAVTWVGHATVLAQLGALNVLTDPIFSERASPLSRIGPKRVHPPALSLAQLPRIDLVLISHNHYDHLDLPSVRALAAQAGGPPLFLVPLGLERWFADAGIRNVVELDWWQSHRVGAVEVVLTPVQHWSGRAFSDRMKTLWGGYAVFAPDLHLYFAGDTGYSKDFADIRARFADRQRGGGFDLALIPVGAYEPRWFMTEQHVNPDEAVRIHLDLNAKRTIGIHWGTFNLTDEPLDEPPEKLAAARRVHGVAEEAFFTVAIGETVQLAPRRPVEDH